MNTETNPHHLVMGELEDFLTGQLLPDTHDQRYLQKISKILVLEKKFDKRYIEAGLTYEVNIDRKIARIKVDFLVQFKDKAVMLIKYGPGSLVTRRQAALALSRILKPYQIPVVIVTNGEDAEILNGVTGKVSATGLEQIPNRLEIEKKSESFSFQTITSQIRDMASRIVYACEVDGACPCDTDICVIQNNE